MDNGSRTAHGDPRPVRTPSREQLSSYSFWIFDRQYLLTTDVAGVCTVVWLYFTPFIGNDPPQLSGMWYRCVWTFSDIPGNVPIVVG